MLLKAQGTPLQESCPSGAPSPLSGWTALEEQQQTLPAWQAP